MSSITQLRRKIWCQVLPNCEETFGVKYYPTAKKHSVSSITQMRINTRCQVLPNCKEIFGVKYYPTAKKHLVSSFTCRDSSFIKDSSVHDVFTFLHKHRNEFDKCTVENNVTMYIFSLAAATRSRSQMTVYLG